MSPCLSGVNVWTVKREEKVQEHHLCRGLGNNLENYRLHQLQNFLSL